MKTQVLWISFFMIVMSTAFAQNQLNTTLVGNWGYGDMNAVAKEGSFVYVGSGSMFCVADVSDSLNPVRKGKLFLNDNISEIIISENFAYVLNTELGLRIVDISDPDTPSLVSTFSTPELATSMAKSEQYVYLGYSNDYDIHVLLVVDVINPASPVQVGSKSFSTAVKSIKISGNYAFIAAGSVGLRVVDISDPTNPTNVGTKPLGGNSAYYIQVADNLAYIGVFNMMYKMYIVDISNPAIPLIKYNGGPQVSSISISGNYAYIAEMYNGLRIYDISNPVEPLEVGACVPPKYTKNIVVDGNFAFVVGDDSGLCIINVSEPENPYIYSSCDIPGSVNDIAFADNNLVYLTDWKGLRAIDFSNPGEPQEIVSLDFQGITHSYITTNNNYVFVYCYNFFPVQYLLYIIDISNPQSPIFLSTISLPHHISDIGIHDTLIYLIDSDGLMVIDIADPTMPIVVFTYIGSYFDKLKITENKAIIQDGNNILIFDITNAINPVLLGSYSAENSIVALDADESYAYLALFTGLEIIDISNPINPVKISQLEFVDDGINDVSTTNGYVYLAGNPGLRIIDIANPVLPVEVGNYQNNHYGFWYVGAKGHNAFVWNNYQLLVIQNDDFWVNIDDPGNPKTNELNVAILPNPSEGEFFIELPENSQSFECEIFNIQGLKISQIIDKGKFMIDISSYPKGIYFMKISQEGVQTLKKLVLR